MLKMKAQEPSLSHPSFNDAMQPSSSAVVLSSPLFFQHTTTPLPRSATGFTPLSCDPLSLQATARVVNCSLVVTNSANHVKQFDIRIHSHHPEDGSTSDPPTHTQTQPRERVFPLTPAMLLHPGLVSDLQDNATDTGTGADRLTMEPPISLSIQSYREQLYLFFVTDSDSDSDLEKEEVQGGGGGSTLLLRQWRAALSNALTCLLLTEACVTRLYR